MASFLTGFCALVINWIFNVAANSPKLRSRMAAEAARQTKEAPA
jgi:hypothetical protein